MGCWNGTCMISNLPIIAGEPIVSFVIAYASFKDETWYSGSCYPTGKAMPISLPIYGEYDDYGGIDSVDKKSLAAKHLLHIFEDDRDVHELLYDIERDQKTIFSNKTEKEVGVGLVMINKHIFNRLIETNNPNKWDPSREKIIKGMKDIRKHERERPAQMKKLKAGGGNLSDDVLARLVGLRNPPDLLGLRVDILEQKDYEDTIKFVIGLTKKHSEKIAEEFAEAICQRWIIEKQMHGLRKLWIGPSGKGSQSRDYKMHLVLADAVKEHIFDSFDGPEDAYLTLLGKRDW